MQETYENLANAIIVQAAKDFRHCYRCVVRNPKSLKGREVHELETFFTGQYFTILTEMDGDRLLSMLKAEVEKEVHGDGI